MGDPARRHSIVVLVALLAWGCNPPPPDESDYVSRIEMDRSAKDEAFRTASDSPVPDTVKDTVLPLAYYPVDASYKVPATLRTFPDSPSVMMLTSTGTQEEMVKVGQLEFILKGESLALSAFVSAATLQVNRLFVPFRDLTSGTLTYPAGRYLELDQTASGIYEVDFNVAFNPYCYYNPTYICPLPPPENRLDIAIEAGEQIKEKS